MLNLFIVVSEQLKSGERILHGKVVRNNHVQHLRDETAIAECRKHDATGMLTLFTSFDRVFFIERVAGGIKNFTIADLTGLVPPTTVTPVTAESEAIHA